MPENTISVEKFKQLAKNNLSEQRIQKLTSRYIPTTVMQTSPTTDLALLSGEEIQPLITYQANEVKKLNIRMEELDQAIKENKENNWAARLKRTVGLSSMISFGAAFILYMMLALIVHTLTMLILPPAIVLLSIFVLSAPLFWFFASKTNYNSTEHQKVSDTLKNETALLCTLEKELTDRNEKTISKGNSNDNDTNPLGSPTTIYSSLYNEKNSQLSDSLQDQRASASISKARY